MSGSPRVGVIGVGAMGLGIAIRVRHSGFEVHVRDIDPARERLAVAAGARSHPHPRSVAQATEVCAIVVVDASQIDTVLAGEDGLLAGLTPGRTVLLCSTIAPEDTARLALRIRSVGADVLDAPISGGPVRAAEGTMSMMIAGDPAVRERLTPLLSALAVKRFVIGDVPGEAAKAKLVNNLLAGVHLAAAAEALTLAVKLGLDPRQMADLVSVSSGQSWMFDDRMPRALAGDFAPRAQVPVLTKDMTLATAVAERSGAPVPLAEIARDLLRATCEAGWRHEDDAAVLKHALARAGLEPGDHLPS